jgi:SAM-dependent methyltransferase
MPDESDGQYVIHKVRYRFASSLAGGARVLDAGCGAGYGSRMLAETARSVVAVDDDREILDWARARYAARNLWFAAMDVMNLSLSSDLFDLAVSLQVMEHIADPDAYLSELRRVLRPGGTLVLSTENEKVHSLHLKSIGLQDADSHVNVMTIGRFRTLVANHFSTVTFLCQRPRGTMLHTVLKALDIFNLRLRLPPGSRERVRAVLGSPVPAVGCESDTVISRHLTRQAPIQVAVCTK